MRRVPLGLILGLAACRSAPESGKAQPAAASRPEADASSPAPAVTAISGESGEAEGTGTAGASARLDPKAAAFVAWLDAEEPTRPEQVDDSVARLEELGAAVSTESFMVGYARWRDWLEAFCTNNEFTEDEQMWLDSRKGKKPTRLKRLETLPVEPYTAEGDWYYGPDTKAIEKRFEHLLPEHERAWLALTNADPVHYGEDFVLLSDVDDIPVAIALYEDFLEKYPQHPHAILARDSVNMHVCGLVAGISASEDDYRAARKRFLKQHPSSAFAEFVGGLVELEAKPGVKGKELVAYIEGKSECTPYE